MCAQGAIERTRACDTTASAKKRLWSNSTYLNLMIIELMIHRYEIL